MDVTDVAPSVPLDDASDSDADDEQNPYSGSYEPLTGRTNLYDGSSEGTTPGELGHRGSWSTHSFGRLSRIYNALGSRIRSRQPYSHPNSETELLEEGNDTAENALKSDPGPIPWCSNRLREIVLGSQLNALLVFLPFGMWTYLSGASSLFIFICNGLTIVPLSAILTEATERIAGHAGDTIGALLNISLGNIVELIILIGLMNNQVHVVQSSILGSILVNILLILGAALCVNAFSDTTPMYDTVETQLLSCLLFVSVFVFLMPTAFATAFGHLKGSEKSTLKMCRVTALVILLIYLFYLIHELRGEAHADDAGLSEDLNYEPRHAADNVNPPIPEQNSISGPQHSFPRTIRFADEEGGNHIHRGSAVGMTPGSDRDRTDGSALTETAEDDPFLRGREMRYWRQSNSRSSAYNLRNRSGSGSMPHSRASSRGDWSVASSVMSSDRRVLTTIGLRGRQRLRQGRMSMDSLHSGERVPVPSRHEKMLDVFFHIGVLFITSALMSVHAEFLVSSIEEVTRKGHLSETVIGLIILPVMGNVAECVTVITVAARGNLDLAIAVAVGSGVQIALCVTPLTIIAGWIMSREMDLTFNVFEVGTLVGTVILVNLVMLSDSSALLRAGGLKGALMCACYAIIGLAAYFSP